MSKISEYWKKLPPEWRFAMSIFVIARLALTFWSLVVYSILPVALQNLDLFGEPVVTVFNLRTSEHHVYSRQVDNTVLSFHVLDTEHMTDDQTGSIWSLHDGQAVQGDYVGKSLTEFLHTSEEIFPYLGMPPAKNILLSLWQRFDANWYLRIAARGYDLNESTVYFPAYPMFDQGLFLFYGFNVCRNTDLESCVDRCAGIFVSNHFDRGGRSDRPARVDLLIDFSHGFLFDNCLY